MTRTDALKVGYVLALVSVAAAVFVGISALPEGQQLPAIAVTALALLVPGRVQGALYRDLYQGTRALNEQRFADAVPHLQAFVAQLQAAPWKRWLLWLAWSIYTVDAQAMAWHNLAIAELGLARPEEADRAAQNALQLDPRYPLPHVTLAQLALMRDAPEEAERQVHLAASKGYRGTSVDRLLHQLQATMAEVEGHEEA